jgi:hypothetical protein
MYWDSADDDEGGMGGVNHKFILLPLSSKSLKKRKQKKHTQNHFSVFQ